MFHYNLYSPMNFHWKPLLPELQSELFHLESCLEELCHTPLLRHSACLHRHPGLLLLHHKNFHGLEYLPVQVVLSYQQILYSFHLH